MSYRRIRISEVRVVGWVWTHPLEPSAIHAQVFRLSAYDEENIGEPTRENVDEWLVTHAGDFQEVIDFEADIGDAELIPWADEDNELRFLDCMNPSED